MTPAGSAPVLASNIVVSANTQVIITRQRGQSRFDIPTLSFYPSTRVQRAAVKSIASHPPSLHVGCSLIGRCWQVPYVALSNSPMVSVNGQPVTSGSSVHGDSRPVGHGGMLPKATVGQACPS